jgi:hypothetical protein
MRRVFILEADRAPVSADQKGSIPARACSDAIAERRQLERSRAAPIWLSGRSHRDDTHRLEPAVAGGVGGAAAALAEA